LKIKNGSSVVRVFALLLFAALIVSVVTAVSQQQPSSQAVSDVKAQEAPNKTSSKSEALPIIDDKAKLEFFKARSEQLEAMHNLEVATGVEAAKAKTYEDVLAKLAKLCGEKASVSVDKDRDPVCKPSADTKKPEGPVK
jgi:hypothetical protein